MRALVEGVRALLPDTPREVNLNITCPTQRVDCHGESRSAIIAVKPAVQSRVGVHGRHDPQSIRGEIRVRAGNKIRIRGAGAVGAGGTPHVIG